MIKIQLCSRAYFKEFQVVGHIGGEEIEALFDSQGVEFE